MTNGPNNNRRDTHNARQNGQNGRTSPNGQNTRNRNIQNSRIPNSPSRRIPDSHIESEYDVYEALPNNQVPNKSGSIGELDRGNPKKKILRRTRHRKFRANPAVIIMLIIFVLIIGVCLMFALREDEPEENPAVSDTTTAAPVDEKVPDTLIEVIDGFEKVSVPTADMHEGDLILVNYAYAHILPEDNDISSVFDYKTKSYKVRDKNTQMSKAVTEKFNILMDDFYANSGCRDVMVVSGYRSVAEQEAIYQDRVETDGAEEAAKYVATPGYSEHHTGMAMDLNVYLSDGSSNYLADYAPAQWFRDHFHEYGFILRYPEDKAEITKISYESWHYRYVGTPHSIIMTDKRLCLEEYTDYLSGYKYGEKYLVYSGGTVTDADIFPSDADAVIYTIPASAENTTELCVPVGCEYTVSGNNVDGFVITAYPKG